MIFVVGPGRCGSSAVARVLHESGVNMGTVFREPDEHNPDGYFEDMEFKVVNCLFLDGSIALPDFRHRITQLVGRRKEPWGFKDPRLCFLLPFYLDICPDAEVIRCHRRKTQIAESFNRCYGWDEEEVERREGFLNRINHPMIDLDMSQFREDSWIKVNVCLAQKC